MTGVSDIKFPRARITVFFVFISVASVLLGAIARSLLSPRDSVVYITDTVRSGNICTSVSALTENAKNTLILTIIIYCSAFTVFPAAVSYAVMIFRGFSLGWSIALLCIGSFVSASAFYPICYFAVNIIIADMCAETVFFSAGSKVSAAANLRALPSYSVKRFTHKNFTLSALAMLISTLPQILSALLR